MQFYEQEGKYMKNIIIIISAIIILLGTIFSTVGIFIAQSAQNQEKELYEDMFDGGYDDSARFWDDLAEIQDTRSLAFTMLGIGMLFFGFGATIFTFGFYQKPTYPSPQYQQPQQPIQQPQQPIQQSQQPIQQSQQQYPQQPQRPY